MSQLKKKCSVVMLPADQPIVGPKPGYYLNVIELHSPHRGNPFLSYGKLMDGVYAKSGQHLYICSADEIKEGDWCICTIDYILFKANVNSDHNHYICGKVVASTDSSLKLPTVSDAFIQKYIAAYNAGTPIVDVMVEYNDFRECTRDECTCWDTADQSRCDHNATMLKLRGNELIISRCKDSWNRDEVITLLKELRNSLLPVTDKEIQITNQFITDCL